MKYMQSFTVIESNIQSHGQQLINFFSLGLHTLEHTFEDLDMQEQQIKDMFDAGIRKYSCDKCRKTYKTPGHLKNHQVAATSTEPRSW